ncbi:MAG: hypothetical protein V8R40_02625 [Dysosmobacter sp.]
MAAAGRGAAGAAERLGVGENGTWAPSIWRPFWRLGEQPWKTLPGSLPYGLTPLAAQRRADHLPPPRPCRRGAGAGLPPALGWVYADAAGPPKGKRLALRPGVKGAVAEGRPVSRGRG